MLIRLEKILLFLVVLFLPTQLGKHFWPSFAYIYSLKIDYLSPVLYFWDILVTGLLVVWLIQRPKINRLALNLFLFFMLTQVLSLIGSSNIGAGLVRLEQYIVAGFFGIYIASVIPRPATAGRGNLGLPIKIATHSTLLRPSALRLRLEEVNFLAMTKLEFICLPLALGIAVESVIAFLQFVKGSTLGFWILGERSFTISTPGIAKFDFYGFQFLRPYGTFPHPNVLAGFILISIILLSFWRHVVPIESQKMLSLASLRSGLRSGMTKLLIISSGLTILLTMSRTVILAGFVSVLFSATKYWRIFAVAIFLALLPVLFVRFSSLLSFDNLTLLRREELVETAWQMFLKFPFFGIGLNNFIPVAAGNLISGPSRFLQPVHNIFLLALSETGLVGLLGLLLFFGYPLYKLATCRMSIGALLPWLTIIFLGMFDHYFLTLPQGYRLLFLVWGLSFAGLNNKEAVNRNGY